MSVSAVLCEVAVDLLETGGRGFRCSRSKNFLEDRRDRHRAKALNPQLPHALDALAALGLIHQSKGYVDPTTGAHWQTAVWPGPELEDWLESHSLTRDDFRSDRAGDEIVLRSVRPDSSKANAPYHDNAAVLTMRREMEIINERLRAAEITVDLSITPPFTDPTKRKLRRIFKLRPGQRKSEAFQEGGRLFGGFWLDPGFSSDDRLRGIRIEGQPIAELDFGQLGLRLLYGIAGAADKLPEGDLYAGIAAQNAYDPDGRTRAAVKKFVNALMNIPSDDWATLSRLAGAAETILGQSLIDRDESVRWAIAAVRRKHLAVAKHLPSEIGRRIQKLESDILVDTLLRLGHRGLIALPVHDAILVRQDHADEAAEIMGRVFTERSGGVPAAITKGTGG